MYVIYNYTTTYTTQSFNTTNSIIYSDSSSSIIYSIFIYLNIISITYTNINTYCI